MYTKLGRCSYVSNQKITMFGTLLAVWSKTKPVFHDSMESFPPYGFASILAVMPNLMILAPRRLFRLLQMLKDRLCFAKVSRSFSAQPQPAQFWYGCSHTSRSVVHHTLLLSYTICT